MMWCYLTGICAIIALNHVVLAVGETAGDKKELANSDLPFQPLTDDGSIPLDSTSESRQGPPTTTTEETDGINSDLIKITTSFPPRPYWQGCLVRISLVGKGIKDTFTGPCWVGGACSLNTKDLMIWGDPDSHPISFYSDKPETLVIIINHVCRMRKYSFKGDKSIITKTTLTDAKCSQILDTIHDRMKDSKKLEGLQTTMYGMAVNAADGVKHDLVVSSNFQSVLDGECQKTVVVKGRGVADSFTVPCTAIKDPQMVRFKGGMLIGNPLKDGFSFFSEEWGTSVVVMGGVCILRKYQEEFGFMKIVLSNIPKEECEEAKKRMAAKRSGMMDKVNDLTDNIKHKIGSLFGGKLG